MEIVTLHHPYKEQDIPKGDVVLVLGFFDGLHRGHQQVIATGKKEANEKKIPLALMTFNQHPSIVFKKPNEEITQYLTNLETKKRLLENLGVDILYVVDFTSSFAKLPPQEFVDEYVVGLHAKTVVSGFDYTYGPKEIADVKHLPLYGKGCFDVKTVDCFDEKGEKVSSTRIRKALDEGQIAEVTHLLGRPYEISGVVVHGEARGRQLGFPTANLDVPKDMRLPKEGVYGTEILVGGKWYESMTSVGHNDTFGEGRHLTVEVNIFDFHEDIYGETVRLAFNQFLRDQVKFNGAEALIEQLHQDEAEIRAYFEQAGALNDELL